MTPFQQHVKRWENCQKCHYCKHRTRVVIGRGKLPAEILFVGEAPGKSENSLGIPFSGPSGQLLDHIIERAGISDKRLYFTNLVCCIPIEELEPGIFAKATEPDDEAIKACRPRLEELIKIANPKLIVCVGSVAADYLDRTVRNPVKIPEGCEINKIVHPSFILRSNVATRELKIQQCAVALANSVEEIDEQNQ